MLAHKISSMIDMQRLASDFLESYDYKQYEGCRDHDQLEDVLADLILDYLIENSNFRWGQRVTESDLKDFDVCKALNEYYSDGE